MRAKVVVCASGEGANFEAIVRASRDGVLQADIVGLIVNRANAGALKRAENLKVPHVILSVKNFASADEWDRAMVHQLQNWQADWVVLAGFLALVGKKTLRTFPNRIVNIHPSLLPKFGGHGMYGARVHEAVMNANELESGATVHLVDEFYDQGRVIAQERVPVEKSDTPATLAQRVKDLEVSLYPRVLNDLVMGRIGTS